MFSFFLPHFLGALRSERPLLPKRAGALWEGPALFGRNRESRRREAAGRRNWPEAVPRKRSGRKRSLTRLNENWQKCGLATATTAEKRASVCPQLFYTRRKARWLVRGRMKDTISEFGRECSQATIIIVRHP